jgi:hypothetical protein
MRPFSEKPANDLDNLETRLIYLHASDAAKRRAARIAMSNRIGRLITSRLSLDEILQTAIETICGDLDFADLRLLLVDCANPEMLVLRAKTDIDSALLPRDYCQSFHQGISGATVSAERQHEASVGDGLADGAEPAYRAGLPLYKPIYSLRRNAKPRLTLRVSAGI